MAGIGLFDGGNSPYGGPAMTSAQAHGSGPTHTSFLVWVAIIGVVLPILILGGLKMGGFSFVFRGR